MCWMPFPARGRVEVLRGFLPWMSKFHSLCLLTGVYVARLAMPVEMLVENRLSQIWMGSPKKDGGGKSAPSRMRNSAGCFVAALRLRKVDALLPGKSARCERLGLSGRVGEWGSRGRTDA